MLITAACNWIEIDITQSLFLYSIEKKKKMEITLWNQFISFKLGSWIFMNMWLFYWFFPPFWLPICADLQYSCWCNCVLLPTGQQQKKIYNTYTVGFFNLIIVLIWQLFLLNFLEILAVRGEKLCRVIPPSVHRWSCFQPVRNWKL